MKTYHVGLEDAGKRPFGHKREEGLVIVHVCGSKDALPPNLWVYMGVTHDGKEATRERVRRDPAGFLYGVEFTFGRKFTKVRVA